MQRYLSLSRIFQPDCKTLTANPLRMNVCGVPARSVIARRAAKYQRDDSAEHGQADVPSLVLPKFM